jgi:hypothetical protein
VCWVEPIVIPSRTVVVKTISFQTDEPFELKEGSYRIEFLGVEGADRRKLSKWGYTFHISSDDEQFLKEKTVENSKGIASATLPLR